MLDHRQTCFELVLCRKRWHRYCRGNTMRAGITFTGKRTSELVSVERSRTSRQKAGCVLDVESNREERDQFKWMSVQEVVTGGEQEWWLTEIQRILLHGQEKLKHVKIFHSISPQIMVMVAVEQKPCISRFDIFEMTWQVGCITQNLNTALEAGLRTFWWKLLSGAQG